MHTRGDASPQPLYFTPRRLVEFTRFYADEVGGGQYPYVDFDADERWHQRIYRDRRIDVWLISWLPTQGTQLHDHGGSSGAFTVLSGDADRGRRATAGARATLRPRRAAGQRSASARTTFTTCATSRPRRSACTPTPRR